MRLVRYVPELFPKLRLIAGPASGLTHQAFVDYYYTTNDACRLHLVTADDGAVVGTIGVEQMPFQYDGQPISIGFASNWHAVAKGAGGHLFLQWMKSSGVAMVFGGSRDTHRILRAQHWSYYRGIKILYANWRYTPVPGESVARRAAKSVLSRASPRSDVLRRVNESCPRDVTVFEEKEFSEDLLPAHSPFVFRLSPPVAYLRWRYALNLGFARYRLFRIQGPRAHGYAVLKDDADRVVVSHCDGPDAVTLAHGVMRSVAAVIRDDLTPRAVLVASSSPEMQRIYRRAGLRAAVFERPLALGSLRRKVTIAADTSRWLVNFDWGDNALRPPFMDLVERPAAT